MTQQSDRKRPTHTLLVPGRRLLERIIQALLDAEMTFTVEPGSYATWYLGLLPEGVAVVNEFFGPVADVGTLGEWNDMERRATDG